jgi:hypothetical protein
MMYHDQALLIVAAVPCVSGHAYLGMWDWPHTHHGFQGHEQQLATIHALQTLPCCTLQ